MHRGIEVCRLLGDPLTQLLQFAIHDDLLSAGYDIAPHLDAIHRIMRVRRCCLTGVMECVRLKSHCDS
ncbi:MAG TPA: hypothetical protein VHT91_29720 [Kofleriaceae bacterium]|jgi:hypothetical protein|nr:hypothetical protein [Kofleriaceae bacterium]